MRALDGLDGMGWDGVGLSKGKLGVSMTLETADHEGASPGPSRGSSLATELGSRVPHHRFQPLIARRGKPR
jgi:hypothetical protein